jgi:hypothetical protein
VTGKRAAAVLLAGVIATGTAGCAAEKTYAVVKVRAQQGDGPFMNVSQLQVRVWNGQRMSALLFPSERQTLFSFSATDPIDFSLSFGTGYHGELRVGAEPLDEMARSMGYGEGRTIIDPGHIIRLDIQVMRGRAPPMPGGPDGGAEDARSTCEPNNHASCGPDKTCYVACFGSEPATLCSTSGLGRPGEACTSTADCLVGNQCFPLTCGTKLCMKLCKDDGECGGGSCALAIPCRDQPTSHKVCTTGCDPRGDGTRGCAQGSFCQFFNPTSLSCDCKPASATGEEGTACSVFADCRPGLACAKSSDGTSACRPICRQGEQDCAAGRACAKFYDNVWGACIPTP